VPYRSQPLRPLRVRYRYDLEGQAQAVPRHLRRPVTVGGPPRRPSIFTLPSLSRAP
jgi:hypothetical protein